MPRRARRGASTRAPSRSWSRASRAIHCRKRRCSTARWLRWDRRIGTGSGRATPSGSRIRRCLAACRSARTGLEEPASLLLSELLELLAPAVPYTLIADDYDPDVIAASAPGGPQPLDRWLRAALDHQGEDVRRSGDTLTFRRRAWPTLRPLQ